jgi:hypothetical protein
MNGRIGASKAVLKMRGKGMGKSARDNTVLEICSCTYPLLGRSDLLGLLFVFGVSHGV